MSKRTAISHPYLQNKVIIVKPGVDKNNEWVSKGGVSPDFAANFKNLATVFPDCNQNFLVKQTDWLAFTDNDKKSKCPDLNNKELTEREYFENILGLNLNPYDNENSMNKHYKNGKVLPTDVIIVNELKLDLSNPTDMVKYKVLLSNFESIAPSKKDYKENWRPKYLFFMEEENDGVDKDAIEKAKMQAKAGKYYSEILEEKVKMLQLLCVMRKVYAPSVSIELLRDAVSKEYIDSPEKFVKSYENPYKELMWTIERGKQIGILDFNNKMKMATIADKSFKYDEALAFFSQAQNQDELFELELQIKNKETIV